MNFIIFSHSKGFSIREDHNEKNNLNVESGEISPVAMKALAYRILAMTETDKIH